MTPTGSQEIQRSDDTLDRDTAVLRVIGEEGLTGFTFEGLKRKLGTHSETLSRVLSRLEQQEILTKTEEGYVVTERGTQFAGHQGTFPHSPGVTLLRTLLPPFSDRQALISGLMGRWFGPMRWLGYSRTGDCVTMKWTTEGGIVQVDAIFQDEELIIEGRMKGGEWMPHAIAASHQLIGYISRMYSHGPNRMAYARAENPPPFEN